MIFKVLLSVQSKIFAFGCLLAHSSAQALQSCDAASPISRLLGSIHTVVKEEPRNRQPLKRDAGSSILNLIFKSLPLIIRALIYTTQTKLKIRLSKIITDHYSARDGGYFFVFKNRCTQCGVCVWMRGVCRDEGVFVWMTRLKTHFLRCLRQNCVHIRKAHGISLEVKAQALKYRR